MTKSIAKNKCSNWNKSNKKILHLVLHWLWNSPLRRQVSYRLISAALCARVSHWKHRIASVSTKKKKKKMGC